MKLFSFRRGGAANRRGFTLAEFMIASGVGSLIAGSVMLMLVEGMKEEYRSLADTTVEQAASDLQSKTIHYLRGMSASEGVVYTTPVTNAGAVYPGYERIVIARGPAPDYPREELRFDPTNSRAIYCPNRSLTNNNLVLLQ